MTGKDIADIRKTLAEEPVLPLSKLSWEVAEIYRCKYATPAERIFMSLNAASTAWHIHEWIWKTTDEAGRRELSRVTGAAGEGFRHFVIAVQKWSGAIGICRQLATAHKHFAINHDRPDVYYEVHHDPMLEEHGTSVTICSNGQSHQDFDVYMAALVSWGKMYVHLGYPSAEAVLQSAPDYFSPSRVDR